jgi:bifunctional non-homologous end joining protein LigD
MWGMRPMLAVPSARPGVPPTGEEWQHEVKWDGIRALADVRGGALRLLNRNEVDVTIAYPDLTDESGGLPHDVLLDGEIVSFDDGLPSFSRIASRMHVRDALRARRAAQAFPATYLLFDVLRIGDRSTIGIPLADRRSLLEALAIDGDARPHWQVSPTYGDGHDLAAATEAAGLEGVVSKRLASTYQPGCRSTDWVKVPHRKELVAVIGGWVPETDSPDRLGSVWVGHPSDEATFDISPVLYPIARAGSGLNHDQRDGLLGVLRSIARPTSPFDPLPSGPELRRTIWVEPVLCVQVRYLGVAPSGVLRQPVLRALRPEVTPMGAPTAELLVLEN